MLPPSSARKRRRHGARRARHALGTCGVDLARRAWLASISALAIGASSAACASEELAFEIDAHLDTEAAPRIELVRLDKSERRLELVSRGVVVASYDVALGSAPVGAKRRQGDGRTPEGRYRIDWRKRDSDYHRALHISYPNAEDRAHARANAVDPGGAIMIHGLPNGLGLIGSAHTLVDWTDGCIAVTNAEIEEIWEWVEDGVPIEIQP